MKKLFSVILALALLCSCCLTAAAVESAAGTWYLQQGVVGDLVLDTATLGMSMIINLNEDGTASGYSCYGDEEDTTSGTWTQDGTTVTIFFDGDPAQNATLENGTLTIVDESSGVSLICTQEEPAATAIKTYVPGAARTDAVLADYLGHWECLLASFDDQQLETAAINLVVELTIAEDSLRYYVNNAGDVVDLIFTPVCADGILYAMYNADNVFSLQLLVDGVVTLSIDNLVYYFTPVAETAEAPAA